MMFRRRARLMVVLRGMRLKSTPRSGERCESRCDVTAPQLRHVAEPVAPSLGWRFKFACKTFVDVGLC